jgi:hypothetical protein
LLLSVEGIALDIVGTRAKGSGHPVQLDLFRCCKSVRIRRLQSFGHYGRGKHGQKALSQSSHLPLDFIFLKVFVF